MVEVQSSPVIFAVDTACVVDAYVEVHHPKFATALWEFLSSQRAPPGRTFQPKSDPSRGGTVKKTLYL